MKDRIRLLRITTVPVSLLLLLRGQLGFMKSRDFDVLAVSADGPEVKSLKEDGVTHQVVEMTRKITPVQDTVSLIRLIRLISKFRPHIVHTHTPKAGLLGMIAAWLMRVPVRMHTVAGLPVMEASGLKRKVLLFTEKITYVCSTHVFPNSFGLANFIYKEISSDTKKIRVIARGSSNGIDTSFFKATPALHEKAAALRTSHGISERTPVFCFIGRIVRDKGINELLAAFVKLTAEIPAKLILVGPFEADLDPVSTESMTIVKNNADVISLGYQSDVRPALLASDIFVFPSYREGFPNVVMQASCMEIPCIVSDINGCNELVTHSVNGILVKPKSIEEIYDAMVLLARDGETRRKFGKKAREFVVAHYDQQYVWNELLAEYHKSLEACTRE